MYSRTARVSIVRWNLKEAEGKSLVRRTEIAYKARFRETSWSAEPIGLPRHGLTTEPYSAEKYHRCSEDMVSMEIWVKPLQLEDIK